MRHVTTFNALVRNEQLAWPVLWPLHPVHARCLWEVDVRWTRCHPGIRAPIVDGAVAEWVIKSPGTSGITILPVAVPEAELSAGLTTNGSSGGVAGPLRSHDERCRRDGEIALR